MFHYRAYGLVVRSEFELAELAPREPGLPDLEIRWGEVPGALPRPTVTGARFEATTDLFLLQIDGQARYLARDGREIVVDRVVGASLDTVRIFLLGAVMAAVLHQRGVLALHASAIEIRGAAALFAGPSGCGKSTLAAAFARRGHRVLADEIAAISPWDNRLSVLPGPLQLSIWADAADRLGQEVGALHRVRPGLEKYRYPLEKAHCDVQLPISEIHVLSTSNTGEMKVVRVNGVDKLAAVMAQTFRPRLSGDKRWVAWHFDRCSAVAQATRIHNFVRPELALPLSEMVEAIERGPAP